MLPVLRKKKRDGAYPAKHRVFEALAPGTVPGHPAPTGLAASACCCSGIVTATITTTTPSNASAATIAIIAIVVVFSSSRDEPTILFLNKNKQRLNALLKIGLTRIL
jgi:hypothetical protein